MVHHTQGLKSCFKWSVFGCTRCVGGCIRACEGGILYRSVVLYDTYNVDRAKNPIIVVSSVCVETDVYSIFFTIIV